VAGAAVLMSRCGTLCVSLRTSSRLTQLGPPSPRPRLHLDRPLSFCQRR
jgi:hypothetical protein